MLLRLGRLINRFIRPYWALLLAVVLLQAVAAATALYLPTLNARIIDTGVVTGQIGLIWRNGGVMVLLSGVQVAAQIAAVWAGASVAMRLGRDIRAAVFAQAMSFSAQELAHFGAPSLLTRTTNDVLQVQTLVQMTCLMLVGAPITMVGGVGLALGEDIGLSWTILVAVVVLGVGIVWLISHAAPLFETMQRLIDGLNRVVREQITGIRVTRAFVREAHEARRFDEANSALTDTSTKVGQFMAVMFPFVGLVMNVSTVAVMWFGAYRIASGDIQIGQLTAFISYLMQILISVMMTTMLLVMAPRAAVCADRIMAVLETTSRVAAPKQPRSIAEPNPGVVFDNVTFSYPGAQSPVLRNIELQLKPGTTTAIIGSTGSGKSTLVGLIPRLFDVSSGRVSFGGVDVRELDPEELWSSIGLVPQRPYLFSGTIASNLRHGNPEATDEELWQALRIAQAQEFVSELAGQLDAPVSQGGINFSGGQRQRLAIARAVVKRPQVLIFDDAFSALDAATDARLRAALPEVTSRAAVLLVAQRVSTIISVETIVVLDNGQIVGRGSHQELLAGNQTYQEIVSSQLSLEEAK